MADVSPATKTDWKTKLAAAAAAVVRQSRGRMIKNPLLEKKGETVFLRNLHCSNDYAIGQSLNLQIVKSIRSILTRSLQYLILVE